MYTVPRPRITQSLPAELTANWITTFSTHNVPARGRHAIRLRRHSARASNLGSFGTEEEMSPRFRRAPLAQHLGQTPGPLPPGAQRNGGTLLWHLMFGLQAALPCHPAFVLAVDRTAA